VIETWCIGELQAVDSAGVETTIPANCEARLTERMFLPGTPPPE
jgi:hypothetical protein